jgi:hypothetical protein
MSLNWPVGASELLADALMQDESQVRHMPSKREDPEHSCCMYWLDPQPMPDGLEHGTHLLVSEVPRPVHWLTRMCSGRHEV